jgi:subtilisin family serine protease
VVTNNSWSGGGRSSTLATEIRRHFQAGILFVAAAGNNGSNTDVRPVFPAGYRTPNVISVAATDNNDGLASFSNFGVNTVDLGAPGVSVLSTLRNNTYGFANGTSMAAPHVAGAIALLKAACPQLTPNELRNTILLTVDPIPSLAGKTATGGRLNVADAISVCAP